MTILSMSSHIKVWHLTLHKQIYSSLRSMKKYNFRTQLTIQLQNWLHLGC